MDYLYSQLNKQVETATYQGRTTATAEIIVDNINYVISANVLDIPQYYINLISTLTTNLDLERERALAAEQSLSQNLNAEINRATSAETQIQNNLSAEQSRAQAAEGVVAQNLADEVSRATLAEQGIQANVTDVATNLAIERTRATNAENVISTNLVLETQRATARENSIESELSADIATEAQERAADDATLQSNIDAEETRATTAETNLGVDIATEAGTREAEDTQLQININTEQTRAETAEGTLQDNIDAEEAERIAADTTLQTNITAEYTRATGAESTLQANINAEETRAEAAEGTLQNNIDAEQTRAEAAETTLQGNIDLKLDTSKANTNILKDAVITTETDNVYIDLTSLNIATETQTGPTRRQIPLADVDNAGLMATADYATLYDLKDRVENLEGKTTRLLYTASTTPTATEINAFVIAEGYTSPFEGIAVVVDVTFHIWHFYENDNIGWRDDGLDTVSTFTNDTAGIIQGSTADGKVYAEMDGTGSVNGWGALSGQVTTNTSDISELTTSLGSTDENLNAAMADITALETRVFDSTVEGNATATTVEPNVPADASVAISYDSTLNKYTYSFDFDIPKGEVGDAECTTDASTGVVTYTVEQETDKTFTSDQITTFNLIIPAAMFHGFYAGVNFRTGVTPPTFTVTGETGLAYPIKKLKRSGVQVQDYQLTANSNELVVIMCDGLNVYCNLMEVN